MDISAVRSELAEAVRSGELLVERMRVLLAQLDGGVVVQVPRQGPWTKQMLETLWPLVNHLSGVVALFSITAERANEAVTYSDVLERSGLDPMQQRNEHARLSRVTVEVFGEKRWPIQYWQGSSEMLYRMGGTVAEWWREIASREA